VIQPQIFHDSLDALRAAPSRDQVQQRATRSPTDNASSVTHDSYNAIGWPRERAHVVAEDMMLAQRFLPRAESVLMVGLKSVIDADYGLAWRDHQRLAEETCSPGDLDAMPFGKSSHMFPLFLLMPPRSVLPPLALVLAAFGFATSGTLMLWAVISGRRDASLVDRGLPS